MCPGRLRSLLSERNNYNDCYCCVARVMDRAKKKRFLASASCELGAEGRTLLARWCLCFCVLAQQPPTAQEIPTLSFARVSCPVLVHTATTIPRAPSSDPSRAKPHACPQPARWWYRYTLTAQQYSSHDACSLSRHAVDGLALPSRRGTTLSAPDKDGHTANGMALEKTHSYKP